MNKKADKYEKTVIPKRRDAKVRPADGNVEQVPLNRGKGMIGLPTGKGMIGLPTGGEVISRGSGRSGWIDFVKAVRVKHPRMSYKEAMVYASKKWKSKK